MCPFAVRTTSAALVCILVCLGTFPADAAVGRTEMSYGVSPGGTPELSIPIRMTEGINVMTPRLAITYVGPGRKTILGVGFSLSGFSYITPCRKTIAQDVNAAPISLTSADRFCLDGARLRLVSGTYGASNATYRTELDQLARVTSLASTNNIPGWFRVETRDGLSYEYGNTADSKLKANGLSGAPTQFWAVNRISDRSGNSIVFVYDTDHTQQRFRPNHILYTSRSGSANYRVQFEYELTDRPDPLQKYTPSNAGGAAHVERRLLKRIELQHESIPYKEYVLEYGLGAGSNQRLTSVQECALPTDDCFPATTVNWQSATAGHSGLSETQVDNATPGSSGVIPLDINGDGYEDIAWGTSGTWKYMLGGASGYQGVVNTAIAATSPAKALPLDWNGDGRMDLLVDWSDGKWRVLKGTSGTGGFAQPVPAGPGSGIPSNTSNTSWTVLDANGDGRDDLMRMPTNALLGIWIRLNTDLGFGAETPVYANPNMKVLGLGFMKIGGASAVRRPDFNGDGRTDLLIYACEWEVPGFCTYTGWWQFVSNGTTYTNVGDLPQASLQIDVRYADFNGDGLTDIAYPGQNGSWFIGRGQGSGLVSIIGGPPTSGYATYQAMTGDYDGDGYDDLYVAKSSPFEWHVFRSTGTGVSTTAIDTNIDATGLAWMQTDVNGDGLNDMARYIWSAPNLRWGTFLHAGVPGELLTGAIDGFGNAITFSYLPMSSSSVYTKGTLANYPDSDFQSAFPLVCTLTDAPRGAPSFTLTYSYAGARVHGLGRAYLGMETRTVVDSRNSIATTEAYRQDFPFIGLPKWVEAKKDNSRLVRIDHTYNKHDLDTTSGNQRYLPYRSQTVAKRYGVANPTDGQERMRSTETRTVNLWGNATNILIETQDKDIGSPESGQIYTTQITTAFSENQPQWCLSIPTSRSERRAIPMPNVAEETRTVSWTVDAIACRVTKETLEPGEPSPISLVTDLGYDTCGNLNFIKSYPAGDAAASRETSLDFGDRCQYPEEITNAEGHITKFEYDYTLGVRRTLRTQMTSGDPFGIATTYDHDVFGRLTREKYPDGTTTRFVLTACADANGWCGTSVDESVSVKITQTAHDKADNPALPLRTDEQLLDGLGRVRWTFEQSLESGFAVTETQYDPLGRVSKVSQPYFPVPGTSVYWSEFQYDLIGRLIAVESPITINGTPTVAATTYEYLGHKLIITDPKPAVTTQAFNVLGQIRSVTDPSPDGGTTSYAYTPFGDIAKITDAAGTQSTWTYNKRGFLTATNDANAGAWTYTPNAFGETVGIVDANSTSFTITYDKLSRPKTRLEPEGTTTWTWGTAAETDADHKVIGHLTKIESPGNYKEEYSFDRFGRLSETKVTADGSPYVFNVTYDEDTGLPATMAYPQNLGASRFTLAYEYQHNFLKRVKDAAEGGITVWEVTSTDPFGQIQDETFGNGVHAFTEFDAASGLMLTRQATYGSTPLIDAEAAWDASRNLIQRKDLIQGLTEDFSYDALNRFVESKRNGVVNQGVKLDAVGNILWKKDVCPSSSNCYVYHATKKHAVVSAGSNSYAYDANGNMTARNGSTITYTSYNLPKIINSGSNSSTISYGAFRNRYKHVAVSGGATETTISIAGLLEKVTTSAGTEYRHLVHGGGGLVAIHTRRTFGTAEENYYVHADHLGSPELITRLDGTTRLKMSFGAFGARRDSDWDGPVSSADQTLIAGTTRHGFTGHEQLDSVSLIHMNGRVFDPAVGRFLSVDPIIRDAANSQSLNAYSYVEHRSLSSIDPSGYSMWWPGTGPQPGDDISWPSVFQELYFAGPHRHSGGRIGGPSAVPPGMAQGPVWDGICSNNPVAGVMNPVPSSGDCTLNGTVKVSRDEWLRWWSTQHFWYALRDSSCVYTTGTVSEHRPRLRDNLAGRVLQSADYSLGWVAQPLREGPVRGLFTDQVPTPRELNDAKMSVVLAAAGEVALGAAMSSRLAGAAATGATQLTGRGFGSFSSLKRALGPAGPGKQWHHIIEQTPGNVGRFGAEAVHNTQNVMAVDATVHAQISAYYSRIQPFTNGQTVRQWLSTQSFEAQRQFGLQVLRDFGALP